MISDPRVYYMPCPNHEAAIEVEGYCPCWDGLEIDWPKTTGEQPRTWSKRTAPEGK